MFSGLASALPVPCKQWRRSVVKYGVRVSHVKSSNCFRRLKKLALPSILTQVVRSWWYKSCSYPTTEMNERMWHYTGSGAQSILWPRIKNSSKHSQSYIVEGLGEEDEHPPTLSSGARWTIPLLCPALWCASDVCLSRTSGLSPRHTWFGHHF